MTHEQTTRPTEAFGAAPHERPVPRISIHAFCEFPDTGAALQRAGADRRLSKAHLTVQLGGIDAAVEHYHGQVTPNLLIVETRCTARRRWTNSTGWPKSAIPPPRWSWSAAPTMSSFIAN